MTAEDGKNACRAMLKLGGETGSLRRAPPGERTELGRYSVPIRGSVGSWGAGEAGTPATGTWSIPEGRQLCGRRRRLETFIQVARFFILQSPIRDRDTILVGKTRTTGQVVKSRAEDNQLPELTLDMWVLTCGYQGCSYELALAGKVSLILEDGEFLL